MTYPKCKKALAILKTQLTEIGSWGRMRRGKIVSKKEKEIAASPEKNSWFHRNNGHLIVITLKRE